MYATSRAYGVMRIMRTSAFLVTALLLAACADARPAARTEDSEATPTVARIICEADGSTSVLTPEVLAQRDGVRLVVDSRLDEPASLIGGFGFGWIRACLSGCFSPPQGTEPSRVGPSATTAISKDPVEAVRQSIEGLEPGDTLSLDRSGVSRGRR